MVQQSSFRSAYEDTDDTGAVDNTFAPNPLGATNLATSGLTNVTQDANAPVDTDVTPTGGLPTVDQAAVQTPVQAPVTEKAIKLAGQEYKIDTTVADKLAQQIIGQGTTSKWQGEGFGSAEANAKNMAEQLAASGITDISQVGQKEITVPARSYETEQGLSLIHI